MLPYPADRAVNLHRYPDGVGSKGFWQRRCRPTPSEWLQRWRNPDDTQAPSSPTRLPPSLSWPTSALSNCIPGRRRSPHPISQPGRCSTSILDETTTSPTSCSSPDSTAPRCTTSVWQDVPRSPASAASRSGYPSPGLHVRRYPPVGRDDLTGGRCDRPCVGQRGMGDPTSPGPHPAGLHGERDQQDPRRPIQHSIRRRRTSLGADHLDEPDDDRLRPDRWTITDVRQRVATVGDPLAALIGMQQRLPL
jgi:bifunctional non-homologous end joining protein LigD